MIIKKQISQTNPYKQTYHPDSLRSRSKHTVAAGCIVNSLPLILFWLKMQEKEITFNIKEIYYTLHNINPNY